MPRKARIDAPGALHHIIIRGIERRAIFKNAADRNDFLKRLDLILPETKTGCYALVLMTNHVHLLLKTGLAPIATVMRRLLTGYAVSFNRRHRRHGQLFQNRYKSFLCEEDVYLKELVRYLHLNPIRAKIVKNVRELEGYPYSGHRALMGKAKHDWQDTEYVLKLFDSSIGAARRSYNAFVSKGVAQGRRPDLVGGGLLRSVGGWFELKEFRDSGIRIKGDERILGSSDFVERVLKQAEENLEERYRLEALGIDIDTLLVQVAQYYKTDPADLKTASKEATITQARTVLCYLAVRKLKISCADVARTLRISPAAVSRAAGRAAGIKNLKQLQKYFLRGT
jgi:REP element-mobilizing transposase RayT